MRGTPTPSWPRTWPGWGVAPLSWPETWPGLFPPFCPGLGQGLGIPQGWRCPHWGYPRDGGTPIGKDRVPTGRDLGPVEVSLGGGGVPPGKDMRWNYGMEMGLPPPSTEQRGGQTLIKTLPSLVLHTRAVNLKAKGFVKLLKWQLWMNHSTKIWRHEKLQQTGPT